VQTESSSLHNIKEGYSIFCDKWQSNDSRMGFAHATNASILSDKILKAVLHALFSW